MTAEYSAHPALASAQLQRAESSHNSQSHHRRHAYSKSAGAVGCGGGVGGGVGVSHSFKSAVVSTIPKSATTNSLVATLTTDAQTTLPDRTANAKVAAVTNEAADDDVFGVDYNDVNATIIEDEADASIDETDHVQHRFSRTTAASTPASHQLNTCSCDTHFHQHQLSCSSSVFDGAVGSRGDISCDGCGASSGFSSAGSSPSASTTSSPLSTPTRLVSSPHCCQKTAAGTVAPTAPTAAASSTTDHQQHQHPHPHQHHHHHHHHHPHNHNGSGCKKLQKFDPRLGPSPYRQLLPIALCILSFATVFSILIVYMDTTEIRHQQFRMNMSRNNELYGVAQDDPDLIAFLREIQMNKYPMHFLKNRDAPDQSQHLNFNEHHELAPEMAHYVADLLGSKLNGSVIQSLPGAMGQVMTAPWLAGTLNWTGVIVEPEPQRFFALRKQNARNPKLQVVHACVSPNAHPKEVTIHNEEADVRINSLLDEETSWFYSRVKCFPLYAIMLACNRVEYDLLSLGVHGHELEILQTLPFEKINIEVISIHLPDDHENVRPYVKSVTQFLKSKSYKLQKNFGRNYFYQKINATNRTRKKDILLMKQP